MRNIYDIDFQYNDGHELEILEDVVSPVTFNEANEVHLQTWLKISVKINNNGNLEVSDTTPYEQWDVNHQEFVDEPEETMTPKHHVLERIVFIGKEDPEIIQTYNEEGLTYTELRHSTEYTINKDGAYHYQKLVIPTLEHLEDNSFERLCYDSINDRILFIDNDEQAVMYWGEYTEGFDAEYKGRIFDEFDELYELIVNKQFNNTFYYQSDVFSIYNLVTCYVMKEKDRLFNYLKNNCKGNCDNYNKLSLEADILLAAVTVLDDLIEKGDFFEAQRILNALDTCGSLCKDFQSNLKGCGCGRA